LPQPSITLPLGSKRIYLQLEEEVREFLELLSVGTSAQLAAMVPKVTETMGNFRRKAAAISVVKCPAYVEAERLLELVKAGKRR
jgi:hypothetical protein